MSLYLSGFQSDDSDSISWRAMSTSRLLVSTSSPGASSKRSGSTTSSAKFIVDIASTPPAAERMATSCSFWRITTRATATFCASSIACTSSLYGLAAPVPGSR